MTTPTSRRQDQGFTLIEVLVALGILVLVALAALPVLTGAIKADRSASSTGDSVQVAIDRLEEVQQRDWRDIGFDEGTRTSTGQDGYDYAPAYYPCDAGEGCLGETTVYLTSSAATPLHATVTRDGFKVHTYISWVVPAGETTYPVNQEGIRYAAKRIRVVVTATRAGKTYTQKAETIVMPPPSVLPPPNVPIGTTQPPNSTATCPSAVTATGSPTVVEWNAVPAGQTAHPMQMYRVYVNGAVQHTAAHDGRARHSWVAPLYASTTTYEVRGVTSAGQTSPCPVLTWTPMTTTPPLTSGVSSTSPTSPFTTASATTAPTTEPTAVPTATATPTATAAATPTAQPTAAPTAAVPTTTASATQTAQPTAAPTAAVPTATATAAPTATATASATPTAQPTAAPTTAVPTVVPTATPTLALPASTCPTKVSARGWPTVVQFTPVPTTANTQPVTTYRIIARGSTVATITADGRSQYTWTASAFLISSTYEVRGSTASGHTSTCTPVATQ